MFFPEGKWINYWPGKAYEGNTTANVDARLTQVPLFVRAGAIIPMREYAPSVELGNNKKLMLDIYPHNSSSFTLFEDDGSSNDYIDDAIARTVFRVDETSKITTVVTEAIKGNYTGRLSQRECQFIIHKKNRPSAVRLNNKSLNMIAVKKRLKKQRQDISSMLLKVY